MAQSSALLRNTFGAIFCCQGGALLLIEAHLGPLWAVGGEVAVVVYIELSLVCACALQELADSAFWVGLGSGLGVEAPWSPCIVDGLEDVVCGVVS